MPVGCFLKHVPITFYLSPFPSQPVTAFVIFPVVNRTPVANHEHQNDYFIVLDLADESMVAQAILPAASQLFS